MSILLALIPGGMIGRLIALAVAAAAVVAGYLLWEHRIDARGYARAVAEQTVRNLEIARNGLRAIEKTITAQQELNDANEAKDRAHADVLATIVGERDRLLASLRNRPARPPEGAAHAADPAAPEPATSCTGAALYREDGEFLAGEAARADRVLAELEACQSKYTDAGEALKRFMASMKAMEPAPP